MWAEVRREMRHLDFESITTGSPGDLLTEWSGTVATLLSLRRALGPVSRQDDPFILLAIASRGALLAGAANPEEPAPRMDRLHAALNDVARSLADRPSTDQARPRTAALQVAYELAHLVRIHAGNDHARGWLLAGETALDGALHAPAPRTPTSAGLAAWQHALVAVQHHPDELILLRGLALGHSKILRAAHDAVTDATRTGALKAEHGRSVQADIRTLAHAHQTSPGALDASPRMPEVSTQAVMLQLGTAVQRLTGRPDPYEDPADRLDALLRSGIGQAALVAGLTADPAARAPADRLQRLALEYLANPRMLQRDTAAAAPSGVPTLARDSATPQPPPSTRGPLAARITPGTVLDSDTVVALCRARDIGTAASVVDPARPPAILHGTDPADWPRLAAAGQQAVADLVASVTPMVYALTRNEPNREDLRGEMFVHLMRVAHTYDPARTNAARWPRYAWETLQHLRWRGVDNAGVPRQRVAQPVRMIGLDGTDPVSRDARPEDLVVGQAAVEATRDAVNALPTRLREPLLLSMAGKTFHEIGDDLGISGATAHRRTAIARRILHRELDIGGQDDEFRGRDCGTRRVPEQSSPPPQPTASPATTPTWETIRSLPSRPAPTLGPTVSSPAPGIGW